VGNAALEFPKKVDMDRTYRSVSLGVFSEFGSVD
jgi:hypothetical protein